MLSNFIKDIVHYIPSQIIPAILGIITIPIFTHLFPPDDYGNYILVLSNITILVTILGWLSTSTIRFYPAYHKNNNLDVFYGTLVKLTFFSTGILVILYLGVLWLLSSFFTPKLYSLMLIGTLPFIAQGLFQSLQTFLQSKRKINWFTGFTVWHRLSSLCIGLLFVIVYNFGVEGLLYGSFIGAAVALPFLFNTAIGKSSWRSENISTDLSLEMAKYGMPLVIGNLAAWILSLSDRYVLEFIRGSSEVGIYSASYGIAEKSIYLIITLFLLASGPLGITIWERDGIKASQEFTTKVTRYFLMLSLPAAIGLSVLAKPIIVLCTPIEYHQGFIIIPLVAFGVFFLGLQQRFHAGLLYYKKTFFLMACIIITGVLNLILNFLFIPAYGYLAAAISTLVSYCFLFILICIISRRFFPWNFPFKTLLNVTCSSAIMGIVIYISCTNQPLPTLTKLIASTVLGGLVYCVLLFLFREFNREEIEAIKDFWSKLLGIRSFLK